MLLPLTFLLASAVAQTAPAPTPAAGSLIAAEYAFSDQSAKDGIRAAFMGAFHKDGLVFIPRPVNGLAYYGTQLEMGASLQWFPTRVETSAGGDLGYSTGPYTFRAAKDAPVGAYGWFVSIWERDGDTPWKVRLDIGVSTPDPGELPPPAPLPRSTAALPAAPTVRPSASPELIALDRTFSEEATKNIQNAYKGRVDATVRLYRKGRFPLEGAGSLQRYLDPWAVDFQPAESVISGSGDLGYTRGTLTRKDPAGTETSNYVHVWKKAAGAWKLAAEVEIPAK
jgi:ketosteroid isomerase-like protein